MDYSFSYASTYDYSSPMTTPSTYYHSSNYYPNYSYQSSPMYYPSPVTATYSSYEQPMITPPETFTYIPNPPVEKPIDRTPLRRHRCFKKNELQVLHVAFSRDPHPTLDVLQQLAEQLKSPVEKVRQWFKNRRHSEKQKQRTSSSRATQ